MNGVAGSNKRRGLFILNRALLALAVLLVLAVLLYAPWRTEVLGEIRMVLVNARLL